MINQYSPVIFGEVLYDCFPDGARVLGGAPFNVAWHCQAFGLHPLFISRVGDDQLGRDITAAMLEWGMNTQGLQLDSKHATGVVNVTFNEGEPSYDIVENSAWDFINFAELPKLDKQSLLYHGSLSLRNSESERSFALVKEHLPDSIFVDVNLRSPWWDLSQITSVLRDAQWVKLNQDELLLLVPNESETINQARYLMSQYKLGLVVVTQGEQGAIAITKTESFFVKPEHTTPVVDTVGAGDAFTSVLLLGLHKDWSLQHIIDRAQQFASEVVGLRGATTNDKTFYQPFINRWSL